MQGQGEGRGKRFWSVSDMIKRKQSLNVLFITLVTKDEYWLAICCFSKSMLKILIGSPLEFPETGISLRGEVLTSAGRAKAEFSLLSDC